MKKANKILVKDMKKKENIYIKLLIKSYLLFMEKDLVKERTKISEKVYGPTQTNNDSDIISVYGGNKIF